MNPNAQSEGPEAVLAVLGDRIVGARHRLRLPWLLRGERVIGATIHDLFLLREGRVKATALNMVSAVVSNQPFVLLAGASKEAHQIYCVMYRAKVVPCS